MKVLWLTENYPPRRGGMAQACDRIINNLRRRGLSIDVVHFGPHHNIKVIQQQNGFLINIPDNEGPGHTLNCLYNILRSPEYRSEYSLIVAFGGYLPLLALPIFKAWFNIKGALLLRGNDFDLGIFSPNRRHLLFDAFAAADKVCVLSTEVAEKIMPFVDPEKIVRIANGIDLAEWTIDLSDQKSADTWRKKNVNAKHKVIGLIGQFKAKKGGTFFLSNVLTANLHDQFHFLLIGDVAEPMQEWLEKHQDKLNFTQLPFLDHFELLRYYPACDFIAIPSFYDGMPNVMLEAGALGIPLIASRIGGIRDAIGNLPEQTDLLFYPGDRHGCQAALWNASQMTPERYHQLSKALQQHIAEHFDSSIETEAYLQLLTKLAQKSEIGFIKT